VYQKFSTYFLPSFPRKRESSAFENKWIPARARSAGLVVMTPIYEEVHNLAACSGAYFVAGMLSRADTES
jgi:hypothetical protein